MSLRNLLLAVFVVLTLSTDAGADVVAVPGSALRVSRVSRNEHAFTVDVTNPTDALATFDGTGLYFLPVSKGQEEPQRLGVVTPGRPSSSEGEEAWRGIPVPPHRTIQVTLTSYCLDAGRPSPPDTMRYRLAGARLPPELSASLARAARSIATLGYDPDTRRPEVTRAPTGAMNPWLTQSAVWRIRARMPTVLLGETPHP
jgi:hypothetical protein